MRLSFFLVLLVLGCGGPEATIDAGAPDGGGALDAPAAADTGLDAPDEELDAPIDAFVPPDEGPPDAPPDAPIDALPDTCGDMTVQPHEACDDGNRAGGDGCRADCLGEEECGDGFVDVGEMCLPTDPSGSTLLGGRDVGALHFVDADRDGDLDVYSPTSGALALFRNDGAGALAAPIDTSTSLAPSAFADVDGDGLADLIALDFAASQLRVIVNEGAGLFSATPSSTPAANGPLAAGDLDGDDDADVVTVTFDGHVHVFLADGTGALTAQPDVTIGLELIGVTLADVNADGHLDVVAVHDLGAANASILTGRGDGTFDPVRTHDISFPRGRVDVADVNGDSDADIVVANQVLPAGIDVSLGNGDGTFDAHRVLAAGGFVFLFQTIDADTDGDADVLYGGAGGTVLAGVAADGTSMAPITTLPMAAGPRLADLDDDGAIDVIGTVTGGAGGPVLAVWLANP